MGDQKPFLSKSVDTEPIRGAAATFQDQKAGKCVPFHFIFPHCRLRAGPNETTFGEDSTVHPHLSGPLLIPQQLEKKVKERPPPACGQFQNEGAADWGHRRLRCFPLPAKPLSESSARPVLLTQYSHSC